MFNMSEDKRGYKKGYFADCMMIFAVFILIGVTVFLFLSETFNLIETFAMAMAWGIPLGGVFLICYLCSNSRDYPEPTRDLSVIRNIKFPQFEIYKFYDDEKRLVGHLEGNTLYGSKNKYMKGCFDDRDPHEIEFIWRGKVVERMKGDVVYRADEGEELAKMKDLKLSSLYKYALNSHIEVDRSNSKAVVYRDYEDETKKVGTIEGDVSKLDDVRAWAIYTFIFEYFA